MYCYYWHMYIKPNSIQCHTFNLNCSLTHSYHEIFSYRMTISTTFFFFPKIKQNSCLLLFSYWSVNTEKSPFKGSMGRCGLEHWTRRILNGGNLSQRLLIWDQWIWTLHKGKLNLRNIKYMDFTESPIRHQYNTEARGRAQGTAVTYWNTIVSVSTWWKSIVSQHNIYVPTHVNGLKCNEFINIMNNTWHQTRGATKYNSLPSHQQIPKTEFSISPKNYMIYSFSQIIRIKKVDRVTGFLDFLHRPVF
jgi:hypothetical protein